MLSRFCVLKRARSFQVQGSKHLHPKTLASQINVLTGFQIQSRRHRHNNLFYFLAERCCFVCRFTSSLLSHLTKRGPKKSTVVLCVLILYSEYWLYQYVLPYSYSTVLYSIVPSRSPGCCRDRGSRLVHSFRSTRLPNDRKLHAHRAYTYAHIE